MKITKIFKKGTSILCLMAILLSAFSPSIAQANIKEDNKKIVSFVKDKRVLNMAKKYNTSPQVIDEDTVFLPLSQEENIEYIAELKKISKQQAKQYVELKNSEIKDNTASLSNITRNAGLMSDGSGYYGEYVDLTGIILKRFNVVSGLKTNCTVVASINVLVRVYWEVANEREFLQVYDSGVSIESSGIFNWNETTNSAVIMPNGFLNFNASGLITGTVDVSLTVGYESAGFSIQGSAGTTIYVNKFHTIGFSFDPDYPGWHLY